MNITIKAKNLLNLKNSIESNEDNYILFYKGKSIKFLDDGFFLIYFSVNLDETTNVKINCLLNKKVQFPLIQLNEKCFIIHKIIKVTKKDIISFKNEGNLPINIDHINIKIHKL